MRPFYSDFEPHDSSRFAALDHYAEEHRHFNRLEDREPPPAPPATPATHTRDEQCTIGAGGCCIVCGVAHADPCATCGGRGYHRDNCKEMDQ